MAIRSVSSEGPEEPSVPMLLTMDSNFTYDAGDKFGGLDREFWKFECPPWQHYAKWASSPSVALAPNESLIYVYDDGEERPVIVQRKTEPGERIVNDESQYSARFFEYDQFPSLAPATFINSSGNLEMWCRRTTGDFEDHALGNVEAFNIVASNYAQKTVTVRGQEYDRRQNSDNNLYERGKHIGFDRFRRDELVNDDDLDLSWKKQKYDYGFVVLKKAGYSDATVRYSHVSDSQSTDPRVPTSTTTTHTLYIMDDIGEANWPGNGDKLLLLRHMPYYSTPLTTNDSFEQHGGMTAMRFRVGPHGDQFFSLFGWSAYFEILTGLRASLAFEEADKSAELDGIEVPGGGLKRRFHNIWAPTGGMYDYAASNGLTPIVTNPEWTDNYHQQHQILNDSAFLDYRTWTTVHIYHWLADNPAGKPANSVEWYGECSDGKMRRIGGCFAPPWWNNGVIDGKQLRLTPAAYGNFNRDMDKIFNTSDEAAKPPGDFLCAEIDYIRVYQHEGQIAGGQGSPGRDGKVTILRPSPNGPPGSGTGRVQAGGIAGDGSVTPTPPGGGVTPSSDAFDDSVSIRAEVETFVEPRANKPIALTGRIVSNPYGYSIGWQWTCSLPNTYSWRIIGADALHAQLVFDDDPVGLTGHVLQGALTLTASETGGKGTADAFTGRSGTKLAVTSSAPIDTGDTGGSGGGNSEPDDVETLTITVTDTGPTVRGVVSSPVLIGRGVYIALLDSGVTGLVQEDLTFEVTGIPSSYNGQGLRAYVTTAPPSSVAAEGGHFVYQS